MAERVRIGDVAARAGVNPKTIRYYEDIGLLPEPQRTPSGHRLYDGAAEERLTFIKTAQRLGMTLDEIREILALRDSGDRPCGYVREVLRREVAQVEQRLAALSRIRDELLELDALADHLSSEPGMCQIIEHVRQKTSRADSRKRG